MPKLKGGIKPRRTIPVFFRVSEWEDREITRQHQAANLPRAVWARAKLLNMPFEMFGGKTPKASTKPTANEPTNPTA